METKVVKMGNELSRIKLKSVQDRVKLRLRTMEQYMANVPGTLQKRQLLGWEMGDHALRRRIEEEFGHGFELAMESYVAVSLGKVASVSGLQAQTEAAWLADRRIAMSFFPEDKFVAVEINVSSPDGEKTRSGIALVLTQTSAAFIPRGHVVFKFLTRKNLTTKEEHSCVHVEFPRRSPQVSNSSNKRVRCTQGTLVVPMNRQIVTSAALKSLVAARTMSKPDFIRRHGSTTLNDAFGYADAGRRNDKGRLAGDRPREVVDGKLYTEERTAFVFGYPWRCVDSTDVFTGPMVAEGDTPAVSTALKLGRRYQRNNIFPEDDIELCFLEISNKREHREGIGLICYQTSAQYVPQGKIVCCLLAEYDPHTDEWLDVVDPECPVG